MNDKPTLLFSKFDLGSVIAAQEQEALKEIRDLDPKKILSVNSDDLCDYIESKHTLIPITLKGDEITVSHDEVDVDVSLDFNRAIRDRSRPAYVKGTKTSFHVPFEGDPDLFFCCPSSFNFSPPRAIVGKSELVFTFVPRTDDPKLIRSEFDREIADVRKWLKTISEQVAPYNESLRNKVKQWIDQRRQKLVKDQELATGLGFPMKKRSDAPTTFVVPTTRKRILPPTMPTTASSPLEPTLDMVAYEDILRIVSSMVTVMERSPKAFRDMAEEDLRQHFLVQLNAQFEGQATGETFNFEGKTDILIRVEGKNIFIAECKFWDGPQSLKKTLDQLLGYVSWRDTKTAIIIFNRNRKFSTVLEKIPEVIRGHSNYVRDEDHPSESGFRFTVHHKDDTEREMTLTVLAFEVPS